MQRGNIIVIGLLVVALASGLLLWTMTREESPTDSAATAEGEQTEETPNEEEPENEIVEAEPTVEADFTIVLTDGWTKSSSNREGYFLYEKGAAQLTVITDIPDRGLPRDTTWNFQVDTEGSVSDVQISDAICGDPESDFCSAGSGALNIAIVQTDIVGGANAMKPKALMIAKIDGTEDLDDPLLDDIEEMILSMQFTN